MRKAIKYLLVISILVWAVQFLFLPRRVGCVLRREAMTISTVSRELFSETIPLNGMIERDTATQTARRVKVQIDELYVPKITKGLTATTAINYRDYLLTVTQVFPELEGGRFYAIMEFAGDTLPNISQGKSIRARLSLSGPSEEILVPVGGFYKDTGGKWIYVVDKNEKAVKRVIKLGRKNPDYFEVVSGLKAGERVITSSYENFPDKSSFSLWEVRLRKPLSLM